jgi:hypothetical protein
MAFPTSFKELCTPAAFYFVVSIIGLILVMFQNLGNDGIYSLGSYSTRVPSTVLVFIFKFIYVLFWTYILNLICKDGHKEISWFLVLLPFLLLFVILGLMMM